MTLKKTHLIRPQDVFIDRVGVGKGAYDRLHELDNRIVGVNAGSEADEKSRYLNLRAEMYWRLREWVLRGGKLEKDDDWYQLADVKYKAADSSGRIKIMSKEEMLREGIDSPDVADALALTFSRHDIPPSQADQVAVQATMPPDDPYDQVSFIGQVEDPDPYA